MRIDSAILTNAIITASSENPIVSGSVQVNIAQTTGYSTFSSSIQTYTDAKVAGLVDSAPGTLNTLNELAAALGDDANMSASFATTLGTKLPTATHTAFSSSNASALRTEYAAGDAALSASAHTQRAAIDAKVAALDSTYATDASVSSLSASAHTRREQISASLDATIDALDSLGISTDTERGALSASAHTQREAIKGLATTANNSLSSSTAAALRTEYVAGDSALSASAHTRRNELHALQLLSSSVGATINDNAVKLSGIESGATADQSNAEIRAAVEAASDSNVFTDADHSKLNAIEASADVTDATNVAAAGALMDSEVTDLAGIKAVTISTLQVKPSEGAFENGDKTKLDAIEAGATADQSNAEIRAAVEAASDSNVFTDADHTKLNGIEASADVTDATNVTAAGALMDSELTNIAAVKALNQGLTTTSDVTFADLLVTGDLTVQGTRTELQVATLNVEDLNITVASGSADSAAADGAGLTIAGANESLTWDHGNSRFNFSDDLHIVGNITVSGNVDGRDVASDGSKLDGIESSATADQTGAEIKTALFNESDTNNLTDTLLSKLNGIEASATADQTAAEIRTLVDGASDSNVFTDALKTKLDGIAASATNVTNNNQLTNGAGYVTSNTQLSDEQVQDIVGAMVTGNTESGITVTYQDGDGTIDFSVASQTDNNFTTALKNKLDGIAASATNVTNNNQLTNGAGYTTNTGTTTADNSQTFTNKGGNISQWTNDSGYTTYSSNQTLNNNSNVHFEGLMVGQTSGATGNTIRCVGDIVAYYSDDRLKNKIGNLEDALSKVNSLNGFTYTPNEAALALGVDQDEVRVGVSAQEVQAVLPEAVKDAPVENTEGYLTVQYEKVVPLLIEAIKELSAKVEELSK